MDVGSLPVQASTARASAWLESTASSSRVGASTSWAARPVSDAGPIKNPAATPARWLGPWNAAGTGSSAMLSSTLRRASSTVSAASSQLPATAFAPVIVVLGALLAVATEYTPDAALCTLSANRAVLT